MLLAVDVGNSNIMLYIMTKIKNVLAYINKS